MLLLYEKKDHKQYEVKEGIIFLIELTDSLFKPLLELNGRCQLYEILSSINTLMSDMIVSFPKNGVGIYLYNSDETGSKFPKNSGMTKIFSLNDLNSSSMKLLSNIVRDDDDDLRPLLAQFFPRVESLDNLQTILRTILREFQRKVQYNRTKLLWFTSNDKPYIDPQVRDSLRTTISDFKEKKISIVLNFLDSYVDDAQTMKRPFELSLYETIFLNTSFLDRQRVSADQKSSSDNRPKNEPTEVPNKIKDSIFRLNEVRRMQFSCNLILSDGPGVGGALGCSIKGYTLFDHEKVRSSKQVFTEGEVLRQVHVDSVLIRSDTKAELNPEAEQAQDIKDEQNKVEVLKGILVKFSSRPEKLLANESNEKIILIPDSIQEHLKDYSFNNVPACYNIEEISQEENSDCPLEKISFSTAPYLKLLCFRHMTSFQPYFNMKPALFVTADLQDGLGAGNREGGYANSRSTLTTLYQSCVKLRRYALVFGCTKLNSTPNLYAMYPTNASNEQLGIPDGFLLINLPWLGEIRSLPEYLLSEPERYFVAEETDSAPIELVNAFKKIFTLMGTVCYNPKNHSNPVLQYFYKIIKQEALQIDVKDEDQTVEGNDWSIQRLIKLGDRFRKERTLKEMTILANSMLNSIGNAEFLKRAAEDDTPGAKRQKSRPLSEADIIMLWKNDTWDNATVVQLRDFSKRYDSIEKATRKADVVANIVKFLESRHK